MPSAIAAQMLATLRSPPPFDLVGAQAALTGGAAVLAGWLLVHVGFGFLMYVAGSIAFDVAHVIWHLFMRSPSKLWRSLGYLHAVHHYYFNRRLVFNERFADENLYMEILLEYGSQSLGVLLVYHGFYPLVHPNVLYVLAIVMFVRVVIVFQVNGKDSNHIPFKSVPVCKNWLVVGPEFHALHHVFPDNYFSSFIKVADWIYGSAYAIKGRRILMTGASGAFGAPLKELLETVEGAKPVITAAFGKDWNYDDYSFFERHLQDIDILILCHGSKEGNMMEANCVSVVKIIEIFRRLRAGSLVAPEVWAIGTEIEFHPALGQLAYLESKRAFMEYARWYYERTDLLYRHIVPSAFNSRMGYGIISGATAVWMAMGFIRAGFQFIPVTYSTFAFWHFFKFNYFVTPKDPAQLISSKNRL